MSAAQWNAGTHAISYHAVDGHQLVACAPYGKAGTNEWAKHARLMAAAPELLSALHGVLQVADRQTEEFDAARAAIAKASGVVP